MIFRNILVGVACFCSTLLFALVRTDAEPVSYTVTELKFADSPEAGTISPPFTSWEPRENSPHICKVMGLSQNNVVTGLIVAASGVDHLFVFEDGKILDLTPKPKDRCLSATVSPDGVVLAVSSPTLPPNAPPKNVLQLYQKKKLRQIGLAGEGLVIVEQLNARGNYLLEGPPHGGVAFLCTLGGSSRVKAPDVGVTLNSAGAAAGIELINGELSLVPVGVSGGKPIIFNKYAGAGASCIYGCLNQTGQFVCSTALGLTEEKKTGIKSHYQAYVFDLKTKSVKSVPLPEGVDPLDNAPSTLSIDDAGDVLGTIGAPESSDTFPFYYHAGKSVRLSTLVLDCASIAFQSNDGRVLGQTKNGSLFLYANGNTTNLGSLGGDQTIAKAINKSRQVIGSAKAGDGQMHAFVVSDGSMVDLNSVLPAAADLVLESAEFINDAGMIVAKGHSKTADSSVVRWYALVPGN